VTRTWSFVAIVVLCATPLFAEVALTDKGSALRVISGYSGASANAGTAKVTPAERAALRAANEAKRAAKRAKRPHGSTSSSRVTPFATGSISLIDAGGLKYFINSNITFSTSSSASGAASEASYTAPINASTTAGGVDTSSLSDMFDGYNGLCVSLTNATGPCQTGNASYTMYEKNGAAAVDATVPAVPECTNRHYVLPAQTIGGLSVRRKVYVPTNDRFIRWGNYFTNTTGAPITFTMVTSNNLGSDSNTRIVTSSSGDAVAQTSDLWVTTFQLYSGTTSSDPRIGHILQGTSAPTPVSNINFADGDDNPYWTYSITLAPGQTKLILDYATGLGSKTAAATQSAALAAFGTTARQCLSATELGQVANFAASTDLSITKTSSPVTNVNAGQAITYTLAVTNNGPSVASSVSVTDPLPAGVTFVNASGTGWACNQAAGTVTCTMASLAVGAANPITITATAPLIAATLDNTATVAAATSDPTPANDSSLNSLTVVQVADLSIVKTSSPASLVSIGGAITYTLAVSNAGPSAANAGTVTDPLPTGATFVSARGKGRGGAWGQAAGTVT